MRFRPTFILARLVVTKAGKRVYDEAFHTGMNVIRGENGSGKTTIADLIFFALGGETPQWRQEAALCDYTYAELHINGIPVTFRRQIEQEKARPLAIFWGNFEYACQSQAEWSLYPYAGTSSKESFSQIIFQAAGIPEVKGSLQARVTLHQVLRLVYADQKTDYDALFRFDPFDQHLTREAVGDLLCGVYDAELYEAESLLATKKSEQTALQAELRTILSLLGDQAPPSKEWLAEEKASRTRERKQAYDELAVISIDPASDTEGVAILRKKLARELAEQNTLVHAMENQIGQAKVDFADREHFVAALQARRSGLDDSQTIHERLGALAFSFCPACLAPLQSSEAGCILCKAPSAGQRNENVLRLRHEIDQQIRESQILQGQLQDDLANLTSQLRPAHDRQRNLQLQYDAVSTTPNTSEGIRTAELNKKIGYLDRSIEDLEQRSRFAERIAKIIERQAEVASTISRLTSDVETRQAIQRDRKTQASKLVSEYTKDLIRHDLPRETAFQEAERVDFDFGANRISVDGARTFAASSNVLLKNSFHAALLKASCTEEYFRYPRLAMFDNVEDKGMEPGRSHNFQRLVYEMSASLEAEHQVILFTSMIAPELEANPNLLIGRSYTHNNKTLQF